MNRLIKYLGYAFFLPLWWLQILVPRNKNIWVFGVWYGQRYSDNSMYLFEYVTKHDSTIKAIWVTKNKGVKQHLIKKGHSCYMAYSLKGIYHCLRSMR